VAPLIQLLVIGERLRSARMLRDHRFFASRIELSDYQIAVR
jgi:hypothetical protein